MKDAVSYIVEQVSLAPPEAHTTIVEQRLRMFGADLIRYYATRGQILAGMLTANETKRLRHLPDPAPEKED